MLHIIYDLDDTLYPVNSIKEHVGWPIKEALVKTNNRFQAYSQSQVDQISSDLWYISFNEIAVKYNLDAKYEKALEDAYKNITMTHDLEVFPDVKYLEHLKSVNYLVTTGYEKLQISKLEKLKLNIAFREVFIDDLAEKEVKGKAHYFRKIIEKYKLPSERVVVIGDNLNSEIKAGNSLGLKTVWINRYGRKANGLENADHTIDGFHQLSELIC